MINLQKIDDDLHPLLEIHIDRFNIKIEILQNYKKKVKSHVKNCPFP